MEKLCNGATRLFYLVFLALMGLLLFNTVFFNPWFDYHPLVALPLAAAWLAAFFGLWRLCGRLQARFEAAQGRWLLGFFLLLCAVQLFFYWQAGAWPNGDLERVYVGAYNYTVAGVIEDPYLDYFYKYPNNMPLTILLQFFFRIFYRLTGSDNFILVGVLYNLLCIDLGYLFVYLCARQIGGVRLGFCSLGLLLLCLPLHCYITFFYTDTTTLFYAPFAVWLYLCLRRQQRVGLWLAQAALLGLVAGFGIKQKYSVVIALVAVVIDALLRCPLKAAAVAAAVAAGFLLWGAVFDGFMYAHILDRQKARDAATPFLSWVMMSMRGDGSHNPEDNMVIWYWPTKEEREWQARVEIRRRLEEYGPAGYLAFLNRKGVRSFGSGDLDVMSNPALSPMRQTFVNQCIWDKGRYYDQFRYIAQGYHLALFAVTLAGAAQALRRRDWRCFVPHLSLFGLYLFLLLWEARQRYLLNYMGLFVIAGAFGLSALAARRAPGPKSCPGWKGCRVPPGEGGRKAFRFLPSPHLSPPGRAGGED